MKHESVHELFSQAAEKFGAQIAIERAARRVTYAELEANTNRLANCLLAAGMERGVLVAILADDTIEVVTAIIAVLKAGGVFVPLDPSSPEKRLQAMIAEVTPQWFLLQTKFLHMLTQLAGDTRARAQLIALDDAVPVDDPGAACERIEFYGHHPNTAKPGVQSQPDDMCYIYFTSGSTGRPKGIAGRLKGIDHFIRWEIKTLNVGSGVRVSQLTTPAFDAFLRDIFTPLCAGGTVCVPASREIVFDAGKLSEWLDESRINIVHCVPSLFRALVNQPLNPAAFAALQYILLAGEPLLPADVKRWMDVYGDRVQLVNLYGPTETTMTKLYYFVQPADQERRFIPIGKPMEGARALVLNAQGQACPPGAVGEIYIRTPYRTLGYYNQPELTKEVFVQNPFNDNPHDIVYRTGDLGRLLDDENFEFLGRKDQQVKIRGVRIELREIEDLLRSQPSVKDVAVVDLEDTSGNKYLCAYVVLAAQTEVAQLREHLSANLPNYMLPSAFVVLAELPRTISGKVDRRALPKPAQWRTQQELVAPRTPLEETLAQIWCQVLNVERVGIHSNFFELGGHSLLATQLLSRVRAAVAVDVPLRALFATPTVAGLALAITQIQLEQGDEQEMSHLLAEIKQTSDDDLDALLQAQA
jgi:amino acid adenylation domain-containing protein